VAQLLIRDLDPETVNRLKERARRRRRSLQGEIRLILEQEAAAGADDAWELAGSLLITADRRLFEAARRKAPLRDKVLRVEDIPAWRR
jgi:plasmid stability protein